MLSGINWLAVVVAAAVGFGVGAVWFGPLFGKVWMKALDKKPEELGHPAKAMGLTAVTTLITAAVLADVLDVVIGADSEVTLSIAKGVYWCREDGP